MKERKNRDKLYRSGMKCVLGHRFSNSKKGKSKKEKTQITWLLLAQIDQKQRLAKTLVGKCFVKTRRNALRPPGTLKQCTAWQTVTWQTVHCTINSAMHDKQCTARQTVTWQTVHCMTNSAMHARQCTACQTVHCTTNSALHAKQCIARQTVQCMENSALHDTQCTAR